MNNFFKNQSKPNKNKNNDWSSNQRGNQGLKQQSGNSDARNEECFECHRKGHQAWECVTKFNKLKKANQNNRAMPATFSDDEGDSQSHD